MQYIGEGSTDLVLVMKGFKKGKRIWSFPVEGSVCFQTVSVCYERKC